MDLFEFLMVLLSIIVGLGIAEILTGTARILRDGRLAAFSWAHSFAVLSIFLALLQTFWESWGLRSVEAWTYPAMLLMLGGPVLLYVIANVLFPGSQAYEDLGEYYFARTRLIWSLAVVAVIVGVLFRPLAFGMPLFVRDNLSSGPALLACLLLATISNRTFHNFLLPLMLLTIILDTVVISYLIR
jgi:hypothetical protein